MNIRNYACATALCLALFAQASSALALTLSLPGVASVSVGGSSGNSGLGVNVTLGGNSNTSSGSSNSSSGSSSSSGTSTSSQTSTGLNLGVLNLSLGNTTTTSSSTSSGMPTANGILPLIGTVTNTISPIISAAAGISTPQNTGTSTGGSSSSPALLSISIDPFTSTVLPGGIPAVFTTSTSPSWQADSSDISITLGSGSGYEGSSLLSVVGRAAGSHTIKTLFATPRDWSDYNTIGVWVLPDESIVNQGDLSVVLYGGKDQAHALPIATIALPKLSPSVWQYVHLDLSNCPPAVLKTVIGYGFSTLGSVSSHIHFYPFQLGPGTLDHLRVLFPAGKIVQGTNTLVQVIAEDVFGNALRSGSHAYQGIKHLVFSNGAGGSTPSPKSTLAIDATATIAGVPLGKSLDVNFKEGISEPLKVSTVSTPNALALNVSDGLVSSLLGDFSFGGIPSTPGAGSTTHPASSLLSASPMPGVVGTPELITVSAYDESNILRTNGGDSITVSIAGANAGAALTMTDLGNGTYQGIYTPTKAGIDSITGLIAGGRIGQDMDGSSDGVLALKIVPAGTGTGTGGGSGAAGSSVSAGGIIGNASAGGVSSSGSAQVISVNGQSCTPYMTKYIRLGAANDPTEVKKLQTFLKSFDFGSNVSVSGIYDSQTYAAVMKFQDQYVQTVLTPWNLATPTGYVYVMTLREINMIMCSRSLNKPVTDTAVKAIAMKAPYCPYFTAEAAKGAQGPEVGKAQQFLKDMNYLDQNAPLGTYGTMTSNAISAFQTTYKSEILDPLGIAATGRWGALTMKVANKLMGCISS